MSKKDEALKLALKKAFDLGKRYWQQANSDFTSQWRKSDVTLASFNQLVEDTIRDALAEQPAQQQEPVAWMYVNKDGECEQIEFGEAFDDPSVTLLYTAPPKREWVGLTETERINLEMLMMGQIQVAGLNAKGISNAIRAVEQVLKERNT